MLMLCGFLLQHSNFQSLSSNNDNLNDGKFSILHGNRLDHISRTDKHKDEKTTSASNMCNYKYSLTWNSLYVILEKQLVLHIGFPSEIQNELWRKQKEENTEVSCIAESINVLCYLSTDGYCKGQRKGTSKWENIVLSNKEEKLNIISCGDRYLAGKSEKNEAYLIDFEEIGEDEVPIFKSICPKIQIKGIRCGKEHVLLLTTIGTVFTMGVGSRGQLGHGTVDNYSKPCMVEALQAVTVIDITAGGWHSAVVSDIGDIYCWGWNESGQLGLPCEAIQKMKNSGNHESNLGYVNIATLPEIVDLPGLTDDVRVTRISCGSRHTAAITESGELYTWGWNEYGQLGLGDNISRDIPTHISYLNEQNYKVSNVLCGGWTTLIEIQS